jgi:hypothetical protein
VAVDPGIFKGAPDSIEQLLELREMAVHELEERHGDREGFLKELEALRVECHERGESDEAILEVMDFVTGWCSPHMRI